MKTTQQPTAKNAKFQKLAQVALTTKQTTAIKGGNSGSSTPPTTSSVHEDIIGG